LTFGEYLRHAALAYDPFADQVDLEGLVERVRKSTAEASYALTQALKRCSESDRRIAAMEAAHAAGEPYRPEHST
jgi:hypothetical protein